MNSSPQHSMREVLLLNNPFYSYSTWGTEKLSKLFEVPAFSHWAYCLSKCYIYCSLSYPFAISQLFLCTSRALSITYMQTRVHLYFHPPPKLQTQYPNINWNPPFVCLTSNSRSKCPGSNHVILIILFPEQFSLLPAVCIHEWHQRSPHQTN